MSISAEQIPADSYVLDPIHSSFGFAVKYNVGTFRSDFAKVSAQLSDGALSGDAEVSSIQIGVDAFKGHLMSPAFFDAENYPEITFRSTDIRPEGDGSVTVDGDLSLRGVTKAVTATGNYGAGADVRGNDRVAFEISTTIDRREFGLDWQAKLPNGNNALAWAVVITADLQLVKQG